MSTHNTALLSIISTAALKALLLQLGLGTARDRKLVVATCRLCYMDEKSQKKVPQGVRHRPTSTILEDRLWKKLRPGLPSSFMRSTQ